MNIINTILGIPLGYIVRYVYGLTENYGVAIIIFAFVAKILIFATLLMAHKNSIRFLKLQPEITILKKRFSGDKEQLNEERFQLFKREKYRPLLGLLPLAVQLVLILGVLQVMYNPLQHILHLPSEQIEILVDASREIRGQAVVEDLTTGEHLDIRSASPHFTDQLHVLREVQSGDNTYLYRYRTLLEINGFDPDEVLSAINSLNMRFVGLNLTVTPSLLSPSPELLIVLFAALSALFLCVVQNKISPGSFSQTTLSKNLSMILMIGLSLFFALTLPAGIGLYWAAGNLGAIVVAIILDKIYPPKKLATDAIAQIEATKKTPAELRTEKSLQKTLKARSNADYEKFKAVKKDFVVFAMAAGEFKYCKTIIDYILENSDVVIHYVTNDENDAVFEMASEQFVPYFITHSKTISLMLHLDCKILATTVPDLQVFHIKRSVAQPNLEYIHVFHAPVSSFVQYRERAFDYFDTIFCVGEHHIKEMKRREEIAKIKPRRLVKTGYGMYDLLLKSAQNEQIEKNEKPRILVAPSWQSHNILETCIDDVLASLVGQNYQVLLRPHPQFVMLFPEKMEELKKKFSKFVESGELVFETDFKSSSSTYSSDLLITDWSGIAYEFAYCTNRPCVFINTPQKIMNQNYKRYGFDPMEVEIRDRVGISLDIDKVRDELENNVKTLLGNPTEQSEKIKSALGEYLFYPNRSGEAGGKYIIKQLENKSKSKT